MWMINRYLVISCENSELKLRMLGVIVEKKLKDFKFFIYIGGNIIVIKFKKCF